jgi:hypothetical protein
VHEEAQPLCARCMQHTKLHTLGTCIAADFTVC